MAIGMSDVWMTALHDSAERLNLIQQNPLPPFPPPPRESNKLEWRVPLGPVDRSDQFLSIR